MGFQSGWAGISPLAEFSESNKLVRRPRIRSLWTFRRRISMLRSISVERLSSEWSENKYDVAIAAVGYERRARYIFETYAVDAHVRAAAGFPKQQVFEFQENSNWFEANGFAVKTVSDHHYGSWLASQLALTPSIPDSANRDSIHLIIDI